MGSSHELQMIQDFHREVIRLSVSGMRTGEIARKLKLHPASVSAIKHSAITQPLIRALHANSDEQVQAVRARVVDSLPLALERLEEILSDDVTDPKLWLSASKLLLASGLPKEVIHKNKGLLGDDDALDMIRTRARKFAVESGEIVDTECEELSNADSESSLDEIPSTNPASGVNGNTCDPVLCSKGNPNDAPVRHGSSKDTVGDRQPGQSIAEDRAAG